MIAFIKRHIVRLFKAFGYSCEGLFAALKTEPAFVLECLLCLILIPIALYLPFPVIHRVVLISSLLLLLIIELLNSGIEAIVDRISLEKHELSKKAKDVGSAAVFVAVLNALFVWALLLYQLWLTS